MSQTWYSAHIGRDGAAGNMLLSAVIGRFNGVPTAVYVVYDYKSNSSIADFVLEILYKLP